jgi:hypothetical protein
VRTVGDAVTTTALATLDDLHGWLVQSIKDHARCRDWNAWESYSPERKQSIIFADSGHFDGEDQHGGLRRLIAFSKSLGYPVSLTRMDGWPCCSGDSVTNYLDASENLIRLDVRLSDAQRVQVMAHELAHVILHHRQHPFIASMMNQFDHEGCEAEAECVAWMVCRALGIDSSAHSLGYITCWIDGPDNALARLEANKDEMMAAVREILEGGGGMTFEYDDRELVGDERIARVLADEDHRLSEVELDEADRVRRDFPGRL